MSRLSLNGSAHFAKVIATFKKIYTITSSSSPNPFMALHFGAANKHFKSKSQFPFLKEGMPDVE